MDAGFIPLNFTYTEGLSGFRVADRHHRSPDWYIAKKGAHEGKNYTEEQQIAAAIRFADHIWNLNTPEERAQKEGELAKIKELLAGKTPIFLTVPSTSGNNLAATGLAGHFREKLGVHGKILDGREYSRYAKPIGSDVSQMKDVDRKRRSYMIRDYGFLPGKVEELKAHTKNKAIIVVEDVCASAASVRGFCEALGAREINVFMVYTGLGQSRILCNEHDINEMQTFLDNAGINHNTEKLSRYLTPAQLREVRHIFRDMFKLTKEEKANVPQALANRRANGDKEILNAINEITSHLQGVLDRGIIRDSRGPIDLTHDGKVERNIAESGHGENERGTRYGMGISIDGSGEILGKTSGGISKGRDGDGVSTNPDDGQLKEGGEKQTAHEAAQEQATSN